MISEVDIRDWEHVDFKKLERQVLEGGMLNQNALLNFVKHVEKIRDRQAKEYLANVPALVRKPITWGEGWY